MPNPEREQSEFAEAIWEQLMNVPGYGDQPDAVKTVLRPFINALPEVLADQFDHTVTLSSLMKAKLTFLRYLTDHGYIEAMIDAQPTEVFEYMDKNDMTGILQSSLEQALQIYEKFSDHTQEMLKISGQTEDQVMRSNSMGLKPEVLDMYDTGKLTIGKLLEMQPIVIVKNTK